MASRNTRRKHPGVPITLHLVMGASAIAFALILYESLWQRCTMSLIEHEDAALCLILVDEKLEN